MTRYHTREPNAPDVPFTPEEEAARDAEEAAWAPPEPNPVGTSPTTVACAKRVTVADGDIVSVEGCLNIAAACYLDVGSYLLLFLVSEPDADYFVEAMGQDSHLSVVAQDADSITLAAMDAAGSAPADPTCKC